MAKDKAPQPFSFVRLALLALGAGAIVLVVSIPIILLLAQWSVTAGLIAALVAIIAIIAAIGLVSQRIVGQAEQQLKDEIAQREQERNNHGG
ncbi:hypothetical protein GOEFS_073_00830 [Gordonia effusa NBRC 100432]|uniref:Uncharacterized protein n=1 Tax=Gordonia effusa NBRC 100432 TaxID=1077974 RepID=H0R1W2_9ACTN|nr:hypothetical protein [Gordonia effusa]GAB19063.1 hypothetical protein GOEFS_073_00830 [Gordonia effusa NBRC 100432]